MVKQYPHTLLYNAVPKPVPVTDGDGDWRIIQPEADYKLVNCRAEMNGNNRTIASQDGSALEYAYVVYLPKGSDVVENGVVVEVRDGAQLLVKAPVKQFHPGQMNSKLYV